MRLTLGRHCFLEAGTRIPVGISANGESEAVSPGTSGLQTFSDVALAKQAIGQ